MVAINTLLVPACSLTTATKLLKQPSKRVLVVGVLVSLLCRQSLNQALFRVFFRSSIFSVGAILSACIDLTNQTIGKLEALVILEDKANQHPHECSVAANLA